VSQEDLSITGKILSITSTGLDANPSPPKNY